MYITVSGSSVFGMKWKTNFFEKKKRQNKKDIQ